MLKKRKFPTASKINELQQRFIKTHTDKGAGFLRTNLNEKFKLNGLDFILTGMAPSRNYIMTNNETQECFIADYETIVNGGNINRNVSIMSDTPKEPLNIVPIKMKDIEFDPSIFNPMITGTPIDKMFSSKGGIFPATNYMIVGDPGIGKSTLTLDILSNVKKNRPDAKLLFISGEMTRIDMYDYVKRYPKFGEIDTIFLGEYLDQNPKAVIEHVFNEGYDLILTDSFVEVQESVKEACSMTSKGAEKWLIDQMVINNQGSNKLKKFTSFLMIQQVTKGGGFVGSNKLKHNTTGMMEIRYSNEFSGDRYIKFTKNRRGCEHDKLYFSLDQKDDVYFDTNRLQRDIDIKERLANEKEQLLTEESLFESLFTKDEKDIAAKRNETTVN